MDLTAQDIYLKLSFMSSKPQTHRVIKLLFLGDIFIGKYWNIMCFNNCWIFFSKEVWCQINHDCTVIHHLLCPRSLSSYNFVLRLSLFITPGYWLGADREACIWTGLYQSFPCGTSLLFPDRKSVRACWGCIISVAASLLSDNAVH